MAHSLLFAPDGKIHESKIVLGMFFLFFTLTPAHSQVPTPASQTGWMQVSQNLNSPSSGPVSISVGSYTYPGGYSLRVCNRAGEVIKTLENTQLTGPWIKTYLWDGTNLKGARVASGVYILRGQDASEVFNARIAVHH
jgi:hypothetical protein